MSTLAKTIQQAIAEKGENKKTNDKAYLEFIKGNFIIPIEKNEPSDAPKVLFLEEDKQCFLPVFDDTSLFDQWVEDIKHDIDLLKVSGVDLLKSLGDNVIVCFNIGSASYKEFHPQEIARMKGIIVKIFK